MCTLPSVVTRVHEASAVALSEMVCGVSAIATAARSVGRPRERRLDVTSAPGVGRAPVAVLVHGLSGSTAAWSGLRDALVDQGVAVATFGWAPFGSSIGELVRDLTAEVTQLIARVDPSSVHLVGHSLGGVLVAQALGDDRLAARVDLVVTIGAPLRGSPWACLLPFVGVVNELRGSSPRLRQIAEGRNRPPVRWLSFTSPSDVIVPAGRSTVRTIPMEHVSVDGAGHCGMLHHPLVIERIVTESAGYRAAGWPGRSVA
jgi:pimeloyl-ACP methyl ester carboxylesterase